MTRIGFALAWLIWFALAPGLAYAASPGVNGLIAWTDLVDPGTPISRRAVFVGGVDVSHPTARAQGQSDSDSAPAWSQDGKRLAFARRDGLTGLWGIFVVTLETGERRQILDTSLPGNTSIRTKPLSFLTWLPDNTRVAFVAGTISSGVGIYTVSAAENSSLTAGGFAGNLYASLGIDASNYGLLARCSFFTNDTCQFSDGSVQAQVAIPLLPDTTFLSLGTRRWWPKTNVHKFAVIGSFARNGVSQSEILGVEYDIGGPQLPRVEQLTDSGLVACVNVANGISTTTTSAAHAYTDVAPSPDAKFLLGKRTKTTPVYDAQDRCTFSSVAEGYYRLRSTGAEQGLEVPGPNVADAAWQPVVPDLALHIEDGFGHPLDGLKVELHPSGLAAPVDGRGLGEGNYAVEGVTPGDYVVRAILKDDEWQTFDVRGVYPSNDPGRGDWNLSIAEVGEKHNLSFGKVDGCEPEGMGSFCEDMAEIYYYSRRYVKWFRETLGETFIPSVKIYTYSENGPNDVPIRTTQYRGSLASVFITPDDSAHSARGGPGADGPVNIEWHELSHHMDFALLHRQSCAGLNHGGLANPDTCDSLTEGLASFLASQVEGSPDYAGLADLESQIKAWDLSWVDFSAAFPTGFGSIEDLAVAALLWDVTDPILDAEANSAITAAGHQPVTYTDLVSVPLPTLWQLLKDTRPATVVDLHAALGGATHPLDLDLDDDDRGDLSFLDPVFLMHGFHRIDLDQSITATHNAWHYDLVSARNAGKVANADVAFTSREAIDFGVFQAAAVGERRNAPRNDAANLLVRLQDASGTPLHGGSLDLTLVYPTGQQTLERVIGDDAKAHLELPFYLQALPNSATVPPCDRAIDRIVTVTAHAALNGYESPDAPSFDNCDYFAALLAATGDSALSLTLNFPEDSTPPVTTADARTDARINQGYAQTAQNSGQPVKRAFWTVELTCADPVESDFASGCWRSEYALDGGPFVPYAGEFTLRELGKHTLTYRSLDAAENAEAPQTLELGVIDPNLPPPVSSTIHAESSLPTENNQTTGTWTVSFDCSWGGTNNLPNDGCYVEYILGNGAPQHYTAPLVLSAQGFYTLRYRGIDLLGRSEVQKVAHYAVQGPDTTPPFTTLAQASSTARSVVERNKAMAPWTVSVQLCDDLGPPDQLSSGCAGTEWSVDGGPFQLSNELVLTGVGVHLVAYRTLDLAGNRTITQSLELEIVADSDRDSDGVLDYADNCSARPNPDQRDSNGDGFGNRCDADFNGNGTVDSNDASLQKAHLGASADDWPDLDLDGNGVVNAADQTLLKSLFRQPPGPAYGYAYDELNEG